MRIEEACALLMAHNEWRRGAEMEMCNPARLGMAIEEVCAAALRYEALRLLRPVEFSQLHRRNLAGENFDSMIDGLVRARASRCRKCGGDMRPGVALLQTLDGIPDFIGGEVCTVSPGGPGRLIECMKCEVCGWSVSK